MMGSVNNDVNDMEKMPSEKDLSCSFTDNNSTHILSNSTAVNGKIHSSTPNLYGLTTPIKHVKSPTPSDTHILINGMCNNSKNDINDHTYETKISMNNNIEEVKPIANGKPPIPINRKSRTPSPSNRQRSDTNVMNNVHFVRHNEVESRKSFPHLAKSDENLRGEKLQKSVQMEDLRGVTIGDENKTKEIERLRNDLEMIKQRLEQIGLQPWVQDENSDEKEEPVLTAEQRANRNRVKINIGGIKHETYRTTLKNIPDTRLSWIAEESAIHSPEYDPIAGEFFFDRHPQVFSHILNYYRTGNLHVPYDVCGPLFEDELSYWGIDDSQVESCCWLTYRQHRDAQETLKEFEGIEFEKDFDDDSEPDLSKYGFNVDETDDISDDTTWYQKWQPIIWKTVEDPYSSLKAKVFAFVSMSLILLSVVLFCLETMSYFQNDSTKENIFELIEGFCVSFFTIELLVRFIFCPEKKLFWKGLMNWIDLLSIIPFFVTLIARYGFNSDNELAYLQSIRVIRVFRIIKLSKHSVGLQILGHTLKASIRELLLLIFFLIIGIVIFSSLLYYCEHREKGTKFVDIPTTFWWAVITMTTVGYGDMVPETLLGKLVGSLCSICGVLMIALPVPVIVNNFNLYYSHAQARLKLPKKKRRMLCGAANALKGPAMEEFEKRAMDDEDSEDEDDDDDSSTNGDAFLPPQVVRSAVKQPSVEISADDDESENEENRLAQLRLKKFARRDSNMFSQNSQQSTNNRSNGELNNLHSPSPAQQSRSGSTSSYALSKRRSLLPTMNSLPEIDH